MLPAYDVVKQALSSSLEQLETLRKPIMANIRLRRWILFGIVILNIAVYVLAATYIFISFILFIVMAIINRLLMKQDVKKFQALYKKHVVSLVTQRMVELYSLPNETDKYEYYCDYHPIERIEDDLIHRSKLFNFNIIDIQGEDLFIGKLGLTDFKLSEIKLMDALDSGDSRNKVTMFQGVLFVADFHKDFKGLTVLAGNISANNNLLGKGFTRLERKLLHRKPDIANTVIKLENKAFNDAFDIRTSDEVEARYLLSSKMMERLLDFKNRGKGRKTSIGISFVDSCMFVSIWSNKNHFDAKVTKEVSEKLLEELYQDLSFYFGLVEDFDLNTRIWSKE